MHQVHWGAMDPLGIPCPICRKSNSSGVFEQNRALSKISPTPIKFCRLYGYPWVHHRHQRHIPPPFFDGINSVGLFWAPKKCLPPSHPAHVTHEFASSLIIHMLLSLGWEQSGEIAANSFHLLNLKQQLKRFPRLSP